MWLHLRSRLHLIYISAVPRLYLGCASAVPLRLSRLYLGCTSAISRLYLSRQISLSLYTLSLISDNLARLYLGYFSAPPRDASPRHGGRQPPPDRSVAASEAVPCSHARRRSVELRVFSLPPRESSRSSLAITPLRGSRIAIYVCLILRLSEALDRRFALREGGEGVEGRAL